MRFHPIAVVAVAGLLLGGPAAAQTPPATSDASAYADLVRGTPGLVAYWRLGEGSGTTARDAVANGPEGTYAPASGLGAPGLLGDDPDTAIRLDGAGDAYVDMGDALDFPGAAPFSLETWIAIDAFAAAYPRVVQKEGVDDADQRQGYLIYLNKETGRLGFERWQDGRPDVVTTPDPIPTGEPVHVAAVYDGSAMRLYVNGAEVSQAPSQRELTDNPFAFMVGVRGDGDSPFSGIVDEVAVYDQALDAVAAHYEAGKGGAAQFDAAVVPAGPAEAPPAAAATPAGGGVATAAPAPTQPAAAVTRAPAEATAAPAATEAAATAAPAPTQPPRAITVAEPTAPAAEPTPAPAVEEPAPAPTEAPATTTATTTDVLNLRAGPTTDTVILNEIPAGTEIEVTGKVVNGFVSVVYEGRAGWVSSDYLDFGAATPPTPES